MKVQEDNQIENITDYRITRCRHARLRQALQFQAPPRSTRPARSTPTQATIKSRKSTTAMELNWFENLFVGAIKATLTLLTMVLTPLTC